MMTPDPSPNPFRFGSLAIGSTFTDRESETSELKADILNGQDVVIFAPRRFGKSSLVAKVAEEVRAEGVLVAQVNLMTTPTKERLAEKLVATIHVDVASPLFRAKERLKIFRGLRITPVIKINPEDGSLGFSFEGGLREVDVDATLEGLFELLGQLATQRDRRVAMVLDEFQEVVELDPRLPKIMRSVFQQQPDVAHIYLGSKRHMMTNIFDNENEPFWRSAKHIELGLIPPPLFYDYLEHQFKETKKSINQEVIECLLSVTHGHPYATQELAYFLWEETPLKEETTQNYFESALAQVLRSEHAHFSLIWDKAATTKRLVLQALALEPGRPLGSDYRRRHRLPASSSVQKAIKSLISDEVVSHDNQNNYMIVEPFFAEWIQREL